MFTGIIEEQGEITHIERTGDGLRLTVYGPRVVDDAQHGDSIAVNGVCLTVVARTENSFTVDVMAQTLGTRVNLERATTVGDRLGGHIVQGHVDGTARVLAVTPGSTGKVLRFSLPPELAPLVTDKGSLTVDGVSLTVSAVSPTHDEHGHPEKNHWFEVSLIPETLASTTLGVRMVDDLVNIETDILARHVARLLAVGNPSEGDVS
jgi:riboflavin synthase